jgi:hypothetical protein
MIMVCGHAIRGVGHSGNKEGRIAHLAEIARRDEQRYEQNRTEPVNPAGWRELHKSPVPVRNCVTASPPLFEPDRCSRCPGRSALQFRSEPNQVVNYVNVVKRICETYAELKNSRP